MIESPPKTKQLDHRQQALCLKAATQLLNDAHTRFQKLVQQKKHSDNKILIEKLSQALTYLTHLPIKEKSHTKPKIYAERAQVFISQQKWQEALKDLTEALNGCPTQATYYFLRGKVYAALGQLEQSVFDYDRSLELQLVFPLALLERGIVLKKLQRYSQALKDLSQAPKHFRLTDERVYQVFLHKGQTLRELGEIQRSIVDLQRSSQLNKNAHTPLYQLGLSAMALRSYQEALEYLNRALEHTPKNPLYLLVKGKVQFKLKDFSGSRDTLTDSLGQDTYNPETAFWRSQAKVELKQFDKALIDIEAAIKLDSNTSKYYHQKGLVLNQLENRQEAILSFLKAIELDSTSIENQLVVADTYLHIKAYEKALKHYQCAKVLSRGKNFLSHIGQGTAHQKISMHNQAVLDFTNAIELEATNPLPYYLRAVSLINLADKKVKKYVQAEKELFRAQTLGYNYPCLYEKFGYVYWRQGDSEKAIYYLSLAIKQLPTQVDFWVGRSQVYMSTGNYLVAVNDMTSAIALNQQNSHLYLKRAWAYFRNRAFKEGISDCRKGLTLTPTLITEGQLYYVLGICYSNLGLQGQVTVALERAIERCPSKVHYWHERAKAYLQVGRYEDALNDFNQVIECQPKNSHAYFGRGWACKHLKNYDKAVQDWQHAKKLNPTEARIWINSQKVYEVGYIQLCEPGNQLESQTQESDSL